MLFSLQVLLLCLPRLEYFVKQIHHFSDRNHSLRNGLSALCKEVFQIFGFKKIKEIYTHTHTHIYILTHICVFIYITAPKCIHICLHRPCIYVYTAIIKTRVYVSGQITVLVFSVHVTLNPCIINVLTLCIIHI